MAPRISDMVVTEGGYGLDEGTKVKVGGKEEKDTDKGDADEKGSGK